jgi:hypothetical protein
MLRQREAGNCKNDKNKEKYFVDDHLELDRPGSTWSY